MGPEFLKEQRLTIAQLANREGVSVSAVWRWILKGCRGHRLESFCLGGKRLTTEEAFQRFVIATNEPLAALVPPRRTPHQRQRAIDAAKKRLTEAGI